MNKYQPHCLLIQVHDPGPNTTFLLWGGLKCDYQNTPMAVIAPITIKPSLDLFSSVNIFKCIEIPIDQYNFDALFFLFMIIP